MPSPLSSEAISIELGFLWSQEVGLRSPPLWALILNVPSPSKLDCGLWEAGATTIPTVPALAVGRITLTWD